MWTCWKALELTLSDVMINCDCFNDWDHSLLAFNEVFDSYFILWMNCYFSIRNYMTIYVAILKMIMMPSCLYFILSSPLSLTCGHIFRYRLSLEDTRYISNVSIIFNCSMLLYYHSWMFYNHFIATLHNFWYRLSLIFWKNGSRGKTPTIFSYIFINGRFT